MTNNFRQLLISVYNDLTLFQKNHSKKFESWKGAYDQIDDVLVIGLKG